MSNTHLKLKRIHPSSLGGFTLEGPYHRSDYRRTIARALDRFFYWLGA
ncbi:hypothetical protein [Burkholderia gladioli]|nr:hypothetical protein [Burkholderia gladioli]